MVEVQEPSIHSRSAVSLILRNHVSKSLKGILQRLNGSLVALIHILYLLDEIFIAYHQKNDTCGQNAGNCCKYVYQCGLCHLFPLFLYFFRSHPTFFLISAS